MLLDTFHGISPRTPEHMNGAGMATVALDVNLSHGTLKPWREPLSVHKLDGDSLTLVAYGCCYFGFDKCVSTAVWTPNCPRLYITGHVDYPEVATIDRANCRLDYQRIGVPNPTALPLVSYITLPAKGRDSEARAYVYTFVNNLGEESAPSYPSTELTVNDGDAVTVSGWAAQDAEWRVEKVRIYRRASGFMTGSEKEQDVTTDFLFVAEVDIATGTYIDTVKNMDLQWAITTRGVMPPPAGLHNITAIDGTETLAGAVGNKLYFSQNGQPWNWPLKYQLTLDDNIVNMVSDDSALYVTTNGRPYTIDGTAGCGEGNCRAVVKGDYPYPDIGCGYAHTLVATPFGAVYASVEGLVMIHRQSAPQIITEPVLATDDWSYNRPDTVRLAYYQGQIVCVTDEAAFMFLLDKRTYQETGSIVDMTTISDRPIDMVLTDNGSLLFLLDDGEVVQWNAGRKLRPYLWQCSLVTYRQMWWPVGRLDTDGITQFTIEGENGVSFTRRVTNNQPFRMSRLGRNRKHTIQITGIGVVNYMRLGVEQTDESNGS